MIGQSLGPYRVLEKSAKAGMGQVYRARDTTLDRDVALKVLPPAFTEDPDRAVRFEREAKVLASLNHPGIAAIYGLENAPSTLRPDSGQAGSRALVLELVEGPTLADRLKVGPIPLDEALPIARQIAEALEAAHEAGVIHRDLKPANIKVKDDGTVKVLDFGLAKALDPVALGSSPHKEGESATRTASATEFGMVMGTPAYMSPEQATGAKCDKRTDVWSFGVVLYQMLAGRLAFDGSTVSHVVASVLKSDPDWAALPQSTPSAIRRLLRRCLRKEARERIPDIGMARIEIAEALDPSVDETTQAVAPTPKFWGRPMAVGLVALLAAAAGAAALRTVTGGDPASRPVARFTIPEDTRNGLALSPDGDQLVYAATQDGVQRLFVRTRDQLDAVPVPGTEGGYSPFFSPDGMSLGFFAEGSLKRVDLDGGQPFTLSETGIPGASWGASGTIMFADPRVGGLMLVPESGGEPQRLTSAGPGQRHVWPEFLPGGTHALFTEFTPGDPPAFQIAVVDVGTGVMRTLAEGTSPRFAATGHLVFGRGSTLWAAAFDERQLELTGSPTPTVEGVQINERGGWAHYAVAPDGTLVYLPSASSGAERSLVIVDRQGREEPLTGIGPGNYRDVRWSPDGNRLVLTRDLSGLWAYDLARGVSSQITSETDSVYENPVWTPDGRRIVYTVTHGDSSQLMWRPADGTGAAQPASSGQLAAVASGFSPDGRLLVVANTSLEPERGVLATFTLTPGEAQDPEPLLSSQHRLLAPAVSPDGEWVAYQSSLSRPGSESEVYIERFPHLGDRQQVSTSGGRLPRWSTDGSELFYMARNGRQVFVVSMSSGDPLTVSARSSGDPLGVLGGPSH